MTYEEMCEIAEAVPENEEPPLCSCGRHYIGADCPEGLSVFTIYSYSPAGLDTAVDERLAASPVAALEAWAGHIAAEDGWTIDTTDSPARFVLCLPNCRGFYYTYA